MVAFQDKLTPIVQEWGKIEVQGMKPAISDLVSGQGVPPEMVGGEARAWQSGLLDLQHKLQALQTPTLLADCKRGFEQALVKYIEAAKLFEKAADGPAPQRQTTVNKGIDAATAGDRIYNEASMSLQAVRHEVGLPTTPDYPDHPAGQSKVGS